jgi:hypothetical protein
MPNLLGQKAAIAARSRRSSARRVVRNAPIADAPLDELPGALVLNAQSDQRCPLVQRLDRATRDNDVLGFRRSVETLPFRIPADQRVPSDVVGFGEDPVHGIVARTGPHDQGRCPSRERIN